MLNATPFFRGSESRCFQSVTRSDWFWPIGSLRFCGARKDLVSAVNEHDGKIHREQESTAAALFSNELKRFAHASSVNMGLVERSKTKAQPWHWTFVS